MTKIRENLANIKASSTLAINEYSKKLESEGREIFKFGLGQSPFPIPEVMVNELKNNAHQKDYLSVAGLKELRESIAKYHSYKNKNIYNEKNVIIGPGSKELIFQLQLVIDAELILPIPSWVSYEPQANIVKNDVIWIETNFEENWHLTPEKLANQCKTNKDKEKLLILNSPNNPSGTIHPDLEGLSKIAKMYKVIVISDEIYGELSYSGSYQSISHYYSEGTIITSGISKWCGAGGWRLGAAIFPNELSIIKRAMEPLASETFSAVSSPIQFATIKAYSEDHSNYISITRKIFISISNFIHQKLTFVGVKCLKAEGGFYMLCDFTSVLKKTTAINSSKKLCNILLEEIGFAMLPGSDFGFKENYLICRIAFVDFDGKNAINVASQNKEIDERFIRENCPKIHKGIEKLINWIIKNQ